MFKFCAKKGKEENDLRDRKCSPEGQQKPLWVIEWDPKEEKFPISGTNFQSGSQIQPEIDSRQYNSTKLLSLPKLSLHKAASDGGIAKSKTYSSLCDSDWDKLEHLLAIAGQNTRNPEAQSALFRIRGLIAKREKNCGSPSDLLSPVINRTSPLRRRSMFVSYDKDVNSNLLPNDIQDMFNETYFPSSYRDVSDANVLDSTSVSSFTTGAKTKQETKQDAHHIRRLANRKSPNHELKTIQWTLKLEAVCNHFDTDEMKKWGWHALDLFGVCDNPMGVTAVKIFSEPGRFNHNTCGVTLEDIASFFCLVGLNYKDNPYHNEFHAIDALMTTRYMVERLEYLKCLTPKECFAALFAAACHDVCHPGVTNAFLVNSGDDLAIMYNDHSVLENFHVAQSFRMLRDYPNFFKGWTVAEKQTFRRVVMQCILGTDMAEHVKHHQFIHHKFDVKDPEHRIDLLSSIIHTADISNPAKPQRQMLDMCHRVMKEFFEQGDREKKIGLPISPLCDREGICIPKTQKGFIQFFVNPWFDALSQMVCPNTFNTPLKHLAENLKYWERRLEKVEKTQKKDPLNILTLEQVRKEVDEKNGP